LCLVDREATNCEAPSWKQGFPRGVIVIVKIVKHGIVFFETYGTSKILRETLQGIPILEPVPWA
jgi:hypothetical protein